MISKVKFNDVNKARIIQIVEKIKIKFMDFSQILMFIQIKFNDLEAINRYLTIL